MKKKGIAEILKGASELETLAQRRAYLLQHDSPVISQLLKICYDPNITFALPKGNPPYKRTRKEEDLQGRLYHEARKMYLFLTGGHPTLSQLKREQLFIDFLESIDCEDAELILAIKDKKMPYKGISRTLVDKTYPGLL